MSEKAASSTTVQSPSPTTTTATPMVRPLARPAPKRHSSLRSKESSGFLPDQDQSIIEQATNLCVCCCRYLICCCGWRRASNRRLVVPQRAQQQQPLAPKSQRRSLFSTIPFWVGVLLGVSVTSFYLQTTTQHVLSNMSPMESTTAAAGGGGGGTTSAVTQSTLASSSAKSPLSLPASSALEPDWSQDWKKHQAAGAARIRHKQLLSNRTLRNQTIAALSLSSKMTNATKVKRKPVTSDDDELVTVLREIHLNGEYRAKHILLQAASLAFGVQKTQLLTAAAAGNMTHATHRKKRTIIIPHRLIWSHAHMDIFQHRHPPLIYQNMVRSVTEYALAFGHAEFPVLDLTPDDCEENLLPQLDSSLLETFHRVLPLARSDFCRLVDLYQRGGYYLDQELQVVHPYVAEVDAMEFIREHEQSVLGSSPQQTAATIQHNISLMVAPYEASLGGFFQNFLAATPRHPVIGNALEFIRDNPRLSVKEAMWRAHQSDLMNRNYDVRSNNRNNNSTSISRPLTHLLYESHLKDLQGDPPPADDAQAQRQQRMKPGYVPFQQARGCCCNFVVYRNITSTTKSKAPPRNTPSVVPKVYFFSRTVGASRLCFT